MKIEIDCKAETKPFDRHYKFCIGSGHAALALRTDYVEQLKQVHDDLGIERVRFHGIFNDDMKTVLTLKNFINLPVMEKYYDISFNQVGVVYDNILKCGMKPFVELSFMPEFFACRNSSIGLSYKANISPPKDYNKWENFIRRFILFLFDRYGAEEIRTWYFEVWNEPNLECFFDGTQEDYFKLYKHTANAVKSIDSALKIGGPSTARNEWISEFIDYCKNNSVPLDFISTHQYMGEAIGHSSENRVDVSEHIRSVMKEMEKDSGGTFLDGLRNFFSDSSETSVFPKTLFRNNVIEVRKKSGFLPLFYTEWNASSTCTAPHNDTKKIAANAVRCILEVEGQLNGSSIWCFSDIFEEINMFPQEFSGTFGLQTIHGIKKPAYRAFQMLQQVGDERFTLQEFDGEIGLGAFKSNTGIQLLLYRTDLQCKEKPLEEVELSLLCRKPDKVTIQRIDDNHCNPLKMWKKMGSPIDMKPIDALKIDRANVLVEEDCQFKYKDNNLKITTQIGINDLQLFKIYY